MENFQQWRTISEKKLNSTSLFPFLFFIGYGLRIETRHEHIVTNGNKTHAHKSRESSKFSTDEINCCSKPWDCLQILRWMQSFLMISETKENSQNEIFNLKKSAKTRTKQFCLDLLCKLHWVMPWQCLRLIENGSSIRTQAYWCKAVPRSLSSLFSECKKNGTAIVLCEKCQLIIVCLPIGLSLNILSTMFKKNPMRLLEHRKHRGNNNTDFQFISRIWTNEAFSQQHSFVVPWTLTLTLTHQISVCIVKSCLPSNDFRFSIHCWMLLISTFSLQTRQMSWNGIFRIVVCCTHLLTLSHVPFVVGKPSVVIIIITAPTLSYWNYLLLWHLLLLCISFSGIVAVSHILPTHSVTLVQYGQSMASLTSTFYLYFDFCLRIKHYFYLGYVFWRCVCLRLMSDSLFSNCRCHMHAWQCRKMCARTKYYHPKYVFR